MANIESLKVQINDLLISKLGEPDEADLIMIRGAAGECGLDNRQFERLLQEIYNGINWTKVRDESEGEDRVNGDPVLIFNVEVKSLNKLGEVLFNQPEKAEIYLKDDVFLKANVNYLSHHNVDVAMAYMDLYHSETDQGKRFLKVCYRLNAKLPYRIADRHYTTVIELFTAGFKAEGLMNKIYQEFASNRLSVWLNARDPVKYPQRSVNVTVGAFLNLIYDLHHQFPFFIDKELFNTPADIVEKAMANLPVWEKLWNVCSNGHLFIWFDAFGHKEWRDAYREHSMATEANETLTVDEKKYECTHALLFLIDPATPVPEIAADVLHIEERSLPAAKSVSVAVQISLTSPGFVRAAFRLLNEIPGVTLDKKAATFFDLANQKQAILSLLIDPQKLDKNIDYNTAIEIVSPFQTITIPVQLKAVFPVRTFVVYLVKYSLFGGIFFGFFRWLLTVATGHAILPLKIITTAVTRSLPENYPVFYWIFLAMLASLALSFVGIRKFEKI